MESEALPVSELIDAHFIEQDLDIPPHIRRNLVHAGVLPEPVLFIGRKPRWRVADYRAVREQILARKRQLEQLKAA